MVSNYAGGPWDGYSRKSDYATRNSIACTPGTLVKADNSSIAASRSTNDIRRPTLRKSQT